MLQTLNRMIQKLLPVIVAGTFLCLGSCVKEHQNVYGLPDTDTVQVDSNKYFDTTISLSGIKDIRMLPLDKNALSVSVKRNNSSIEKISMLLAGLPEGVKYKWSSPSGYPTFTTNLEVTTAFTKPGTYPLVITTMDSKKRYRNFKVSLVVDSLTQYGSDTFFINHAYQAASLVDTSNNDTAYYNYTQLYYARTNNNVMCRRLVLDTSSGLGNFPVYYTNDSVRLLSDMNDGTLTIPEQKVNARNGAILRGEYVVSGKGKVDPETGVFHIYYSSSGKTLFGVAVYNEYILEGRMYF